MGLQNFWDGFNKFIKTWQGIVTAASTTWALIATILVAAPSTQTQTVLQIQKPKHKSLVKSPVHVAGNYQEGNANRYVFIFARKMNERKWRVVEIAQVNPIDGSWSGSCQLARIPTGVQVKFSAQICRKGDTYKLDQEFDVPPDKCVRSNTIQVRSN
jgi:hypothetical protein